MTKALLICTFVLLVSQYALSSTVVTDTGVKTEEKKETEAAKNPVVADEKSKDEEYKEQLETGTKIQGEGAFVVNAEQLPKDARDEVMKLLNTQYRLSQEKKAQQKKQQEEEKQQQPEADFKQDQEETSDFLPSEDISFDPELASGIAELLTRMAVEDEEGNQYLDLSELPAELRSQVANYLIKQEQMEEEMIMEDLIKDQMKAEAEESSKPVTSPVAVASLANKHQPSGSQVGGLLGSLIGGAVGGYPAYGGGHYPGGGHGHYGGYPQYHYGGYPQYGQYGGYPGGGYPGGGHHHHHHHGYGYSAYPAVEQSYGVRQQRPQGIVVNRQQLASLLASDPSLAAHVVPLDAGTFPGYPFPQPSYNRQTQSQFYQSGNPFAAYYQQLLNSQKNQPITGVKYPQAVPYLPKVYGSQGPSATSRIRPSLPRFPNQYRF